MTMCDCPDALSCEVCGSMELVETYQGSSICDRCLNSIGRRLSI